MMFGDWTPSSEGSEEDEEEEEKEVEDTTRLLTVRKTKSLCHLALESPDILRAARAGVPLKRFGALMRSSTGSDVARGEGEDCYNLSFAVMKINEFWSHSWHGPAWPKLATLWLHYSSAGGILGSLCGVMIASTLMYWTRFLFAHASACLLHLMLGSIGFVIGLLLWDSGSCVFLDKVCISQSDPGLKAQGIASIGGFLRYSDCMLILWDPTYLTRTWCVFELVGFAFLQKHIPNKRIVMRPTFQGAWVCVGMLLSFLYAVLFLGFVWTSVHFTLWEHFNVSAWVWLFWVGQMVCHLPIACFSIPYIRSVARDAASARKQLEGFSFEHAECFCCSNNHRHPDTGHTIPCDRETVKAALVSWFGSVEDAQHFLRISVLPNFVIRMSLSYRGAWIFSLPNSFARIGMVAWLLLSGDVWHMDDDCVYGPAKTAWAELNGALMFPLLIEGYIVVAAGFKERASSWIADQALSLICTIVILLLNGLLIQVPEMTKSVFGCGLRSFLAETTLLIIMTVIAYRQRLWA